MGLYKITFKEKYSDEEIYLYEHESDVLRYMKSHDIQDALIARPKEPGDHVDYYATELTGKLKDCFLKYDKGFEAVSDYVIYVDYSLEEILEYPDVHDYDHEDIIEPSFVSEDEFLKLFLQDVKENTEITPEEKEQAENFLDIVDNWMAKGRKSQRAKERGKKYLKNF